MALSNSLEKRPNYLIVQLFSRLHLHILLLSSRQVFPGFRNKYVITINLAKHGSRPIARFNSRPNQPTKRFRLLFSFYATAARLKKKASKASSGPGNPAPLMWAELQSRVLIEPGWSLTLVEDMRRSVAAAFYFVVILFGWMG
jgi:hypothetical protein